MKLLSKVSKLQYDEDIIDVSEPCMGDLIQFIIHRKIKVTPFKSEINSINLTAKYSKLKI